MTTIYQLSAAESLSLGDMLAAFILDNGDTRKIPMSLVLAFMEENLSRGTLETAYSAPSATGFSVNAESNTHLILTPLGSYATGTIVMPASPTDRDEFLCNCTQSVAALTISGNGAVVAGGPTALTANAFFRLKYDGVLSTWYRIA